MASLRDTVKDYQEELRDGIAWVAFWKTGRSWNAEYFHLEMGDMVIDYSSRIVFYHNKDMAFTKKEFDIISFLSQNKGIVFDRETIYEKVWGLDGIGDNTVVTEHIRRIRASLSMRKLYDERGNVYFGVDEEIRERLQAKLMRAILTFRAE